MRAQLEKMDHRERRDKNERAQRKMEKVPW